MRIPLIPLILLALTQTCLADTNAVVGISSNSYAWTNKPPKSTVVTNSALKTLDKTLGKITYVEKTYYCSGTNYSNYAQKPSVTLSSGGNCVDIARTVVVTAQQNGLKATYLPEKNHLAVRVEDPKTGKAYRYSNGKRTNICY